MGRRGRRVSELETLPEFSFVSGGVLNTILLKSKDELERIAVDSPAFLEDRRIVRSANMDQITFAKECVFKVTLDFVEPIECIPETAARETTDWMLCSCIGTNARYAKVDQRLVLDRCTTSLQSNIRPLEVPFMLILYFEDDEWLVERVLR